jgi:hypothetical protein
MRSVFAISRGVRGRSRLAAVLTLAVVALAASAASAMAKEVNIVSQGEPPKVLPAKTHYFKTIQEAVNASTARDIVLIEPGTYDEAVKVTSAQAGIYIRGMNRNTVIIDGQNKPGNGIEINKANDVWVENLTVRNFDTGCSECGNEIWWNGGSGSGKIGATGWWGSYLTAYDTGLNGGYGIFTDNMTEGAWENIYASGFNDSGIYLGACQECDAKIEKAVMENNALGYSGSNSGGKLIIARSVFQNNAAGIAPNSENPGDGPPPQDGECGRVNEEHPNPTPEITTTKIKRCTIIKENLITNNNNLTVPVNGSTEISPWGVGVELPGDYVDLVRSNSISNNANNGVLGFEYPNPFEPPDFKNTIFFQLAGNRISNNVFNNNGFRKTNSFEGDVDLMGGFFEFSKSINNCVSQNLITGATYPAEIENGWGCNKATTPQPGGGEAAISYLQTLPAEWAAVRAEHPPVGQPAPPAQPTMPNPCKGVPKNALCP